MQYELNHLESYDNEALLNEIRRVATLVGSSKLTLTQFAVHAKVHGSTIQKRFGGWRSALKMAGLENLIDENSLKKNKEEILEAIKFVSQKIDGDSLTLKQFERVSGITGAPVRRIFGSWGKALHAAGIAQLPLGKRYTDEECYENMLAVWTHYGRPPKHREMNQPPSEVGAKAYVLRWETWRKALEAFAKRVNSETFEMAHRPETKKEQPNTNMKTKKGPRDIPLSLRYKVLVRDNFRCKICGQSPAKDTAICLHVDHIYPWSKGGPTSLENLRTLCSDCNLGKGNKIEDEI